MRSDRWPPPRLLALMDGIAAGCVGIAIAEHVAAGGGVAEVVGGAEVAEVVAAGADRRSQQTLEALLI